MDFNLFVLHGSLSSVPELRQFDSGSRLLRFLVVTRVAEPRKRTDVVPAVLWDPPDDLAQRDSQIGDRVMIVGSVQRRFWATGEGRTSRIELVARHVEISAPDEEETQA